MFVLPLVMIATIGVAVYLLAHRGEPHPVGAVPTVGSAVDKATLWPTTIEGKASVAAFGVVLAQNVLINAVHVPYLNWAASLAALVLASLARFVKHDSSRSVLVVFVIAVIGAIASALFVAGEVFLGHD